MLALAERRHIRNPSHRDWENPGPGTAGSLVAHELGVDASTAQHIALGDERTGREAGFWIQIGNRKPDRNGGGLSSWANSIDVDARLTPLDPPGKPAAPTEPGSPVLRMAPACGTIAFLKSDRPADPTAGERNGDGPMTDGSCRSAPAFTR